MSDWTVTWVACWSSLSPQRAKAIESYLHDKLEGGLKQGELDHVVEQLAQAWDSKTNGSSPGIGILIKTIKANRARARGIDTSEPYEYRQLRANIKTTDPGGLARWDIVCECHSKCGLDWAIRLEQVAMASGGFVIPYWATPESHYHTMQTIKPMAEAGIDDVSESLNHGEDCRKRTQ